jgi:hypothetical protein
VATQTINKPRAGTLKSIKLTATATGSYKVEIVATTTKGKKLQKWTSPSLKLTKAKAKAKK